MNNTELTVEQKFAKALLDIRKLRPFYSGLYESIEKIEDSSIGTIGVTSTKMKYNSEFIDKTNYEEFLFIILHELYHISLMHPLRIGDRNQELWNIACDLFVNKLITEEFGLKFGHFSTLKGTNIMLKIPFSILYDENIDTDKDCIESIYNNLLSEQIYKDSSNSQGSGTSLSDSDKESENNQDSSNEESEDSKGSSNEKSEDSQGSSNENTGKYKNTQVIANDILQDSSDKMEQLNEAQRILQEAITREELESGNEIGTQSGNYMLFVKELLKSKLNWRKLLRKYCIALKSTDLSFNRPDKRMYYQSAIYPGLSILEENALKDIKIAIDTSASMSTEDLKYILGQIKSLTRQYKTEAELICWDTTIKSTYSFEDVVEIFKHGLSGRGGTDASCVFNYLDSKDCKVKPKVTLIFTDGYIPSIENTKWKKKYRDTIWVMTKYYNTSFEPPFGKLAIATFD